MYFRPRVFGKPNLCFVVCWQTQRFEIRIVTFDLADRLGIAEAMRKVCDFYGPVDIVINNGGMSSRGAAFDTPLDVDVTVMNVNYFGQVAVTKGHYFLSLFVSPG